MISDSQHFANHPHALRIWRDSAEQFRHIRIQASLRGRMSPLIAHNVECLFLAARGFDCNDRVPNVVLVLIVATLIVRETQVPELIGEIFVRRRLITRKDSCEPLPKISAMFLTLSMARIVNLAGSKSCVPQTLYSLVGQIIVIEYTDSSLVRIDRHICSPLHIHLANLLALEVALAKMKLLLVSVLTIYT